jgi:hypothetical protein
MAIAPLQARNPKNFYLGEPKSPFKLRQGPREPSIPIIMGSLVFLARLAIYEDFVNYILPDGSGQ